MELIILFLIVICAVYVLLPIYVLILRNRVEKLEKSVELIESGVSIKSKALAPTPSTIQPLNTPTKSVAKAVAPEKAAPMAAAPTPASLIHESFDSKSFINALPKIGALALVIGLGFFLKFAIDQGWISIYLRLGMGAFVGALLLILFYLWKDKYPKYSMALAGGGLAIWYITAFAAVQMYSVLDINGGLIVLTIISAIGLLLAYITKSKVLSYLAWGGAYLSPLIIGLAGQSYGLMLVYVSIISISILGAALVAKDRWVYVIMFGGVIINILFSLGLNDTPHYNLNTLVFFGVQLAATTIGLISFIKETPTLAEDEELEFTLILAVTYLLYGAPIAYLAYYDFHDYASIILFWVGIWTFLIYSLVDRLELKKINYSLAGFGSAALSIAVIWQFGTNQQVIGLYILGLIGIIVGLIQKRVELRIFGLVVIFLGIVAALVIPYDQLPQLVTSTKFMLEILGLIVLAVSYFLFKEDALDEFEKDIHKGLQYAIAGLLWLFVSFDLINYFNSISEINQRNLSLSIWWLAYAVILIILSISQTFRPMRKLSLVLFGIVIVKVFLYDVASLETVYRIISFISLGVILLIVSFTYQHNKEKIKQYIN